MLYDVKLRTAQLLALYNWVIDGNGDADVLLAAADDGSVTVGQGDSRISITPEGWIVTKD